MSTVQCYEFNGVTSVSKVDQDVGYKPYHNFLGFSILRQYVYSYLTACLKSRLIFCYQVCVRTIQTHSLTTNKQVVLMF